MNGGERGKRFLPSRIDAVGYLAAAWAMLVLYLFWRSNIVPYAHLITGLFSGLR